MKLRLGLCALALAGALALFAIGANKASSESEIMYDVLTCEELRFSYDFNVAVVKDMLKYYDGCVDFADSPASVGPNDMLACKFIREHGLFVQGIANDIAAVFNIKCAK